MGTVIERISSREFRVNGKLVELVYGGYKVSGSWSNEELRSWRSYYRDLITKNR